MKRYLLGGMLALLVGARAVAGPTAGVGAAMTEAAQKFLASLNDAERAKAVMTFDDPARLDWHNIPKPQRKGLQLRDMSRSCRPLRWGLGILCQSRRAGSSKVITALARSASLSEARNFCAASVMAAPTPAVGPATARAPTSNANIPPNKYRFMAASSSRSWLIK